MNIKLKAIEKQSAEEYPNKIKPCVNDIINDLKQPNTWKIKLTISISFISSKDDYDEAHVMHSSDDE